MTRRSKCELDRALDDVDARVDVGEQCETCGCALSETDSRMGVTAAFVTYECTCDDLLSDGVVVYPPRDDVSGEARDP